MNKSQLRQLIKEVINEQTTGSNSTGSYAPCIQDQQANSSVTQNPQIRRCRYKPKLYK
jgi:hypothetical protein